MVDGCGWVGESCENETEGKVKVENQEKSSRLGRLIMIRYI